MQIHDRVSKAFNLPFWTMTSVKVILLGVETLKEMGIAILDMYPLRHSKHIKIDEGTLANIMSRLRSQASR